MAIGKAGEHNLVQIETNHVTYHSHVREDEGSRVVKKKRSWMHTKCIADKKRRDRRTWDGAMYATHSPLSSRSGLKKATGGNVLRRIRPNLFFFNHTPRDEYKVHEQYVKELLHVD